jgi:hypothetical protein
VCIFAQLKMFASILELSCAGCDIRGWEHPK